MPTRAAPNKRGHSIASNNKADGCFQTLGGTARVFGCLACACNFLAKYQILNNYKKNIIKIQKKNPLTLGLKILAFNSISIVSLYILIIFLYLEKY